jgi:ribosome-binding protein aMBF1 (putative translation factor)
MARAALGWSIADLAQHAGVSISTVQRVERLSSVPRNDLLSSLEHRMFNWTHIQRL